jgi:hypothetical protein
MLNEGNQIHNFIFSSGSGTVINYGSGSGSTSQKVTVPTVPVLVLQRWFLVINAARGCHYAINLQAIIDP